MDPAGLFGNSVGMLTVPWLTARETAALIVVVVSLVFFRVFRERYLLAWGAGWIAYGAFLWVTGAGELHAASKAMAAFARADFVLAIGLFAAAALISAQARRALTALVAVAWVMIVCAAMQPLYFPDAKIVGQGLDVACRLIAAVAAIELLRYRFGRIGLGPLLFAAGLLTLNLNWPPFTSRIPPEGYLLAEVLFGSSILLVVLDDSRLRMRRLAVLNELTATIARGQNHAPMMQTALEKLKTVVGAKAAWFQLIEGDDLVPTQHAGLSPEFLRAMGQIGTDEALARVLQENRAVVTKRSEMSGPERKELGKHGIHQVVRLPLVGKKSLIGMISLGCSRSRRHPREELEFLETAAQTIGIAVENLRLLEQVLRSQRQWMNTFDSIQDLILAHDADFRILKTNQALLQRLEQAPADVLGNLCEEVLPQKRDWSGCPYCERGSGLTDGMDPCFGGQSVVSTSSYAEQGSQLKGTIHVVHDTTARQVAEEKYRMLFEQVQEGVFVATPDGELLDCNDAFVTMLGYASRDELMALDMGSVLHSVPDEREAFRKEIEAHNYVRNFEMTVRRKDGTLLTVAQSCFATRDSAGNIERYQGFMLDITEKKRSEDEMRRRNRELNALNAMAVIATQSFDLDEILNLTLRQVISLLGAQTGSIYLCDSDATTFRRRAGWGKPSAGRASLAEIKFDGGFGDLVTRSRTEVITTDYLPHLPPTVADFVRGDGLNSWIWVLIWGKDNPIGVMGISSGQTREYTNNDENLLVAIGRQLATTIEKVGLYEETCRAYEDLRHTQEQLLQSEKMSAVGQLIAGVAHELNNPLTAILGYAQLLESEKLDSKAMEYAGKIFKQAQRTHRVVQNLLSFARQRKPERQQFDVVNVLEEALLLSDYDIKVGGIKLERDIESGLPGVFGDPHQLEQVFLNIITNALDAMAEDAAKEAEKEPAEEAAKPEAKPRRFKVRVCSRDNQVVIEFHDSGPGIKEPNRIFEPFYTTKSVGKGTGLGLSICYGIVKEHGGEISARNEDGGNVGAVIEIKLPAAGGVVVPQPVIEAPKHGTALNGRILLVEDEEAVLEFERDVLAGAGAKVTTVTSTEQMKSAITSQSFDAVVINGKMPGSASVTETRNWILENTSGLSGHILFTFASLAGPEDRNLLEQNHVPFLVKPFEIGDLIANARRLLVKVQAASAR